MIKEGRVSMGEERKAALERNWTDKLYILNKVDLGKKIPSWLLAPTFNSVAQIFRMIGRLPVLKKTHPWVRSDVNEMRWLPINEDIRKPENVPMPLSVLDRCIETASHRVKFDYCVCRKAGDCKDYPMDIGCLFMGDQAMEIKGSVGHEVDVEEAKEHARRAVEAGLIPFIGKARADCFLFGYRDRHRMLSLCFCCECCCISKVSAAWPLEVVEDVITRLDGIAIDVSDACSGCGECVEKCYVQAIHINEDGKAKISDLCRACGRCAAVCPAGAIEITLEDPDFAEKTYQRILSYTDFL
jgi:NAD-dependent dihydropyrimidine dehydrogenase PreA subunit